MTPSPEPTPMPKRPRVPKDPPPVIYSLRLYPDEGSWLDAAAAERRCTRADLLRSLIADARDCYGLPPRLRETLVQAAETEGLSLRDYIAETLRQHAEDALKATSRSPGSKTTR